MCPRKWLTVAPSTHLPLANDFDSWAAAPSPVVKAGVLLPEKYPEPEPNISRTRCRRLACRSESRHRSARPTSRQAACGDCFGQMGYGLAWCTLEGNFIVEWFFPRWLGSERICELCCAWPGAARPVRPFKLGIRQVCGHRRACCPIIGVSLIAPNALIFFDFGPEGLNIRTMRFVTFGVSVKELPMGFGEPS